MAAYYHMAIVMSNRDSCRYLRHLDPPALFDGFLCCQADADGFFAGDGIRQRGLAGLDAVEERLVHFVGADVAAVVLVADVGFQNLVLLALTPEDDLTGLPVEVQRAGPADKTQYSTSPLPTRCLQHRRPEYLLQADPSFIQTLTSWR